MGSWTVMVRGQDDGGCTLEDAPGGRRREEVGGIGAFIDFFKSGGSGAGDAACGPGASFKPWFLFCPEDRWRRALIKPFFFFPVVFSSISEEIQQAEGCSASGVTFRVADVSTFASSGWACFKKTFKLPPLRVSTPRHPAGGVQYCKICY